MQVSDAPQTPPPGGAAREEVRPVSDGAESGPRSRAGRRFRSALERKREEPGTAAQEVASAAAMAGWFRAESAAAPAGRTVAVTVASAARAVDRVLVGSGPDGAQARIRIGAGALAGTEIQLSTGAVGNVVEARLLTHVATSRQTLSLVMDEIRLRLRDRGIVLSPRSSGARSVAPPDDVEGEGGVADSTTGERAGADR